ncbi:hypothetical protein [Senegalimassilia anaerobia]
MKMDEISSLVDAMRMRLLPAYGFVHYTRFMPSVKPKKPFSHLGKRVFSPYWGGKQGAKPLLLISLPFACFILSKDAPCGVVTLSRRLRMLQLSVLPKARSDSNPSSENRAHTQWRE